MASSEASGDTGDSEAHERRRADAAEARCVELRDAFAHLLREPFDELDHTLHRILEALARTLDVARASLWQFEDGAETIRCTHLLDRNAPDAAPLDVLHKADYPRYFAAVAEQLVIAAHDAGADPRTAALDAPYMRPLGITSMLDVPVVAFGRFVGVLCHEHIGPMRVWSPEEQAFAGAAATQVALAQERDHAKRAQLALLRRSLHDEETTLPNRVHLDNRLEERLARGTQGVAIAVTSVDQYGFLTASLGAKRALLWAREFARQLQEAAPEGAFIARIAPNEFALLLDDVPPGAIADIVSDWVGKLAAPLELGEHRLFLTLSTGFTHRGIAVASDAEAFRNEARLAADDARREGGARVVPFAPAMRAKVVERAGLEQDMRRGLDAQEFDLHYQPIVELATGRCVAMEALLRWNHPQHGVVRPDRFMQVAIDTGIMLELGRRVIRAACHGLVALRRSTGIGDLTMSINMSAPEVLLPGTVEAVQAELASAKLDAGALTIEITESALILDLHRAREAIDEIRACGVHVSLDDFGTAFSSLSWLRELPIDGVKIDRAFVAGMVSDARDLAIVKSIMALAAAFEQGVIAEGIETREQLALLQKMGIAYGQGYLYAAPEPLGIQDAAWVKALATRAR